MRLVKLEISKSVMSNFWKLFAHMPIIDWDNFYSICIKWHRASNICTSHICPHNNFQLHIARLFFSMIFQNLWCSIFYYPQTQQIVSNLHKDNQNLWCNFPNCVGKKNLKLTLKLEKPFVDLKTLHWPKH
jgi:hypothetical protein